MYWMKCIIMVLPLTLGNRNVLVEVHYNESSADHGNRSDLDEVPYHRELNGTHYNCSSADHKMECIIIALPLTVTWGARPNGFLFQIDFLLNGFHFK